MEENDLRFSRISDYNRVVPEDDVVVYNSLDGQPPEEGLIAIPQHILFDGKEFCVQALVGREAGSLDSNALWLTAAYPLEMKPVIMERIALRRPQLKESLEDHSSLRKRIMRKMNAMGPNELAPYIQAYAPLLPQIVKILKDFLNSTPHF